MYFYRKAAQAAGRLMAFGQRRFNIDFPTLPK